MAEDHMATDARIEALHLWMISDQATETARRIIELRVERGLDPRVPDDWLQTAGNAVVIMDEELRCQVPPSALARAVVELKLLIARETGQPPQ